MIFTSDLVRARDGSPLDGLTNAHRTRFACLKTLHRRRRCKIKTCPSRYLHTQASKNARSFVVHYYNILNVVTGLPITNKTYFPLRNNIIQFPIKTDDHESITCERKWSSEPHRVFRYDSSKTYIYQSIYAFL